MQKLFRLKATELCFAQQGCHTCLTGPFRRDYTDEHGYFEINNFSSYCVCLCNPCRKIVPPQAEHHILTFFHLPFLKMIMPAMVIPVSVNTIAIKTPLGPRFIASASK